MATIGIVTAPYLGHIYPTLGVGRELIALGHTVYWICHLDFVESLLPKGGLFLRFNSERPIDDVSPSCELFGMESLRTLYEHILIPENLGTFEQLIQLHKNFNFDFIITDQQAFSGAAFAYKYRLPYVVSVTAPATIDTSQDFPEANSFEKEKVLHFQKQVGVEAGQPLVWSAPMTLIYTSREFLSNTEFPLTYHFIGPSVQHRNEWKVDISALENPPNTFPIVLVSLGSVVKREKKFVELVIDAFGCLDLNVVLVADPNLVEKWPENFHVFSYIPQMRVLDLVDAVVCHAGHNTVSEALSKGLPIVSLPVAFDQSYVARRVRELGVGLRVKYRRLKSEALRSALLAILNDKSYRLAAQSIANSYRRAGGEKYAAKLINTALSEGCSQEKKETVVD